MKNMKTYENFNPSKKKFKGIFIDEEKPSLKEIRKEQDKKKYRNYENALRSKNVKALLEYDDEY